MNCSWQVRDKCSGEMGMVEIEWAILKERLCQKKARDSRGRGWIWGIFIMRSVRGIKSTVLNWPQRGVKSGVKSLGTGNHSCYRSEKKERVLLKTTAPCKKWAFTWENPPERRELNCFPVPYNFATHNLLHFSPNFAPWNWSVFAESLRAKLNSGEKCQTTASLT